jgi:hypothetical protein
VGIAKLEVVVQTHDCSQLLPRTITSLFQASISRGMVVKCDMLKTASMA